MKIDSKITHPIIFILGTAGAVLAVIMIVVFMYSDFQFEKKDTVTKVYFVDNISKAHNKLIEKFNKKYENEIEVVPINVSFNKFSTNERKELLIRYLRSKNDRIDIFAVDQIWVPRFARWAEPLGHYFATSSRSEILPYALETSYYDEQLMAIPHYIDIATMYYRESMLKNFPDYANIKEKLESSITWEELLEIAKNQKNLQDLLYIFPADKYEGLMCSFVEMIISQGGELYKNDSLNLNSPEAKRTLQLLSDLVNTYNLSPDEVTEFNENLCYDYFLKNDAVFLRHWPDFLNNIDEKKQNYNVSDEIIPVPLPHFKYGKKTSIFGGWNLMLSKYSKKKPEAIKFLKFLLEESSQKMMYNIGGYLPVKKSIYKDSVFTAENKHLNYFYNLMKTGVHRPFEVDYTQHSDIITFYLNRAIKNEITVDDALKTATDVINNKRAFIK